MNRGYNRKEYISLIDRIKTKIPDCAISMDMITGFCTESDIDHQETISLMRYVKYDYGYMFKYSERPNTAAEKKYNDDVEEDTKQKRLVEIINLQQAQSLANNKNRLNKVYEVLIEGYSKRSKNHFYGRTTHNCVVVFEKEKQKIGDYVNVKIYDCTAGTLKGKII
jgi:tRNA-2-methylthio-N6-dimethylallyladenosine synthase